MVFDRIMKDPEILAEFAFVYQLGLTELQLVKDMIHPTRVRVECEVSLKVKINVALCMLLVLHYIYCRTGKRNNFCLRFETTMRIKV